MRLDDFLQITEFVVLSEAQCRSHAQEITLARLLGAKVQGLCSVPEYLVPRYFVLLPQKQLGDLPGAKSTTVRSDFLNLLRDLEREHQSVYIRSNAYNESILHRGFFRSLICQPTITELYININKLKKHPTEQYDKIARTKQNDIAYIVQPYIPWKLKGHLSNERRLSKQPNTWRLEYIPAETESHHSSWFTTNDRERQPNAINPSCVTIDQLKYALQQLAASHVHIDDQERYHFEWIWDATRFWIVQKDVDTITYSERKPSLPWHSTKTITPSTLKHFVPYQFTPSKWPKLDAFSTFQQCQLPVTDFYSLSNDKILQDVHIGNIPNSLRSDLSCLLTSPLVIRTDLTKNDKRSPEFLLPRSNVLTNLEKAETFLFSAVKQIAQAFEDEWKDMCFIAHHYIPFPCSALAYAQPSSSKILIHASWGMPDGLLYHGYDSLTVQYDPPQSHVLEYRIQYKGEYINIDSHGAWQHSSVPAPWDWQPALDTPCALSIAHCAAAISQYINSPITVMFLVQPTSESGKSDVRPWFYNEVAPDFHLSDPSKYTWLGKKFITVSNTTDLQQIINSTDRYFSNHAILLKPNQGTLRSNVFLNTLSDIAKKQSIPIYLEGSFLSHAYYILKRNNLPVHLVSNSDKLKVLH